MTGDDTQVRPAQRASQIVSRKRLGLKTRITRWSVEQKERHGVGSIDVE
jgi:hypothetical protein